MNSHNIEVFATMTIALGVLGAFAVMKFTADRRRERVALYESEVLRKAMESPGPVAERILEQIEHERVDRKRRGRHGLVLGGLIAMAVGTASAIVLRVEQPNDQLHLMGLVPFLIGLVIAAYAIILSKVDPLPPK